MLYTLGSRNVRPTRFLGFFLDDPNFRLPWAWQVFSQGLSAKTQPRVHIVNNKAIGMIESLLNARRLNVCGGLGGYCWHSVRRVDNLLHFTPSGFDPALIQYCEAYCVAS
jgi:hypothetical protein